MLDPARNVFGNFVRVQDQDYDLMLQQVSGWADFPIDVIDLQLRHDESDEISLSWHLTAVEKRQVQRTLWSEENQAAFLLLQQLTAAGAGAPAEVAQRVAR
ncbi:MAG: hypothetical protein IPI41_18520 [Flavobacteriales bacterium]|nr:hypothetical protein [Flavobacteriales bacterium]